MKNCYVYHLLIKIWIREFKTHTLSLEVDLCEVWAQAQGQRRGQAEAIPRVQIFFILTHFYDNTDTIMTLFNIEMISWNSFRDSHLPLWASCPCSLSPPATHQQWIFLWNIIINLMSGEKTKIGFLQGNVSKQSFALNRQNEIHFAGAENFAI